MSRETKKRPEVVFGRKLVEAMNWIGQDKYGDYQLSRNLVKEFPNDKVRNGVQRD